MSWRTISGGCQRGDRRRRRHNGPRGALAAGVVLVAGVTVFGAGVPAVGASSPSPRVAVRAAVRKTRAAKTARFSLVQSVATAGARGSKATVSVTGSGSVDAAAHSAQLTLATPGGATIEEIVTGSTAYVKVPPADVAKVPGGKPWVSITLDQLRQSGLTQSIPQLVDLEQGNPDQVLGRVGAATGKVTRVGTSKLHGIEVDEYRVRVAAPNGSGTTGSASRTSTVPVDVWVGHGLVRRVRVEVSERAGAAGGASGSSGSSGSSSSSGSSGSSSRKSRATVTLTFTQFGAPVTITPPPATQVADVTGQASPSPGG